MQARRRWWANVMMTAATFLLLPSALTAEENQCLSAGDVGAVLGEPVSQSGDRVPGGSPQLLTQNCKYETKQFPHKFMKMYVHITASARDAANLLKLDQMALAGPRQPVPGLGDEAILDKRGILEVRKKNLCLSFDLMLTDFNDDTKAQLLKLLATKALSRIH